ncbi:MAG: XdhC family protein [Acidobacteriota bacterium]
MIEFYSKVAELLKSGRRIAIASIISSRGSTPRKTGAKMIITMEGESFFSIGGGSFEAVVVRDAQQLMREGNAIVKRYSFREGEGGLGMTCGGEAEVLIEALNPPDKLIIFGAGHVGSSLVQAAQNMGFEIFVVDHRKEVKESFEKSRFVKRSSLMGALQPDYRSSAIHFVLTDGSFSTGLPEIDGSSYVVIATMSHESDRRALLTAIRKDPAYIGMIGSQRKREELFKKAAAEDGIDAKLLKRVRCPVGLDIGSETPEEIAVSILAEIISVKRKAAKRLKD